MNRENALELLRAGEAGIVKWNSLVSLNGTIPSLSRAHLAEADLSEVNLEGVDLSGANLSQTKLHAARLHFTNLADCNLTSSDLSGANLSRTLLRDARMTDALLVCASLIGANLDNANLTNANLTGAVLVGTRMRDSILRGANLAYALLIDCDLRGAMCAGARLGFSLIASDLTEAVGLERTIHVAPSRLCVDTITQLSRTIPESFLRGCGLNSIEIDKFGSRQQGWPGIPPCFICYSEPDEPLASLFHRDLQQEGILCWMRGDSSRATWNISNKAHAEFLSRCIFIVIASIDSLESPSMNSEIERVLELAEMHRPIGAETSEAKERRALVLVRVDDSMFRGWHHPKKLAVLDQFLIDGTGWENVQGKYKRTFDSLLDVLFKIGVRKTG